MRELISHPGIQFWVYQLDGYLEYTTFLPGQLPRTYELSASHFIGVKVKEQGNHLNTVKGREIHDVAHHASGMRVVFTRNDCTNIDVRYTRPDGHPLRFSIEHLEDTDEGTEVDAVGSPESMNFAKR
jgi:hypothetical protein